MEQEGTNERSYVPAVRVPKSKRSEDKEKGKSLQSEYRVLGRIRTAQRGENTMLYSYVEHHRGNTERSSEVIANRLYDKIEFKLANLVRYGNHSESTRRAHSENS